jgi:hypothetical protein
MTTLTAQYSAALMQRRQKQGEQILRHFSAVLRAGSVLDYGCGQGAFLTQMVKAGIDARGADIGSPEFAHAAHPERFERLTQPWQLSEHGPYTTVVLLDVLEHHPSPAEFLRALGAENLIIKVPMVNGPIGRAARAAAKPGKPALLETLLLVDDVSPHLSFFSAKGLDAVAGRAGYVRRGVLRHADVGGELPLRIRGGLTPESPALHVALGLAGRAAEFIAPVWSDTATFHYCRP